jgi:hypothetical protein
VILTVFEKEYTDIDVLCGPGNVTEPNPGPGISLGSGIQDALKPIAAEVEGKLKSELGVVVQGPLLKAFIKATKPNAA